MTAAGLSNETKSAIASVRLTDLQPSTRYAVYVAAVNAVGASDRTGPIYVTTGREAPGPPLHLKVESVSARSVTLSWLPPSATHGPLDHYSVGYGFLNKSVDYGALVVSLGTGSACHTSAVVHIHVGDTSSYCHTRPASPLGEHANAQHVTLSVLVASADRHTRVLLSNLVPAVQYTVTVRAANSYGAGSPSSPLNFTTLESTPEAAPREVECRGVTSSTLVVRWLPPPQDATNGVVVNYRVAYQRLPEGGNASCICPMLEKIPASTQHSDFRSFVHFSEDVPSDRSESKSSSKSSMNAVSEAGVLVVSEGLSARLVSLTPSARYRVSVAAATVQGTGIVSSYVVCSTLHDPPTPPSVLSVLPLGRRTAGVTWKSALATRTIVSHYQVSWRAVGDRMQRVRGSMNTSADYSVLTDLPNTPIKVWVTAITSTGEILPSSNVLFTASADDAAIAPQVWSVGKTLSVPVGGDVELPCLVSGVTSPTRRWTLNGLVTGEDDRSLTILRNGSLVISPAELHHSGSFRCSLMSAAAGSRVTASTAAADEDVTYVVYIVGPPPPAVLRVIRTTNTTALLHWSVHRQIGAPVQCTTVHYAWLPPGDLSLVSSGVARAPDARELVVMGDQHLLENLRCNSSYSVYVTTHNFYGSSPPSSIEKVRTIGTRSKLPNESKLVHLSHGEREQRPKHEARDFFSINHTHVLILLDAWPYDETCAIEYFTIQFKSNSDFHWTVLAPEILPDKVVSISGFRKHNHYSIEVIAHKGDGQRSVIESFPTASLWMGQVNESIQSDSRSGATSVNVSSNHLTNPWLGTHSTLSVVVSLVAAGLILLSVGLCFYSRRPKSSPMNCNISKETEIRMDSRSLPGTPHLDCRGTGDGVERHAYEVASFNLNAAEEHGTSNVHYSKIEDNPKLHDQSNSSPIYREINNPSEGLTYGAAFQTQDYLRSRNEYGNSNTLARDYETALALSNSQGGLCLQREGAASRVTLSANLGFTGGNHDRNTKRRSHKQPLHSSRRFQILDPLSHQQICMRTTNIDTPTDHFV
ncbi:Fibronectin type III [Trinorchestia longiramus]|nr:Fibronectin type III [Trinorchestia longiramus]